MIHKVIVYLLIIFSLGACRKVAKESVKAAPVKTILKSTGASTNVIRVVKKTKATTTIDFIKYYNVDYKYFDKINLLNEGQLSSLSKTMDEVPLFKEFILKDPEHHIIAFKKLYANRTLRTDIGYLRNVSEQIKLNPSAKPVIVLRKTARNNTDFKVSLVKKTFKLKEVSFIGTFPDFSNYTVFSTKLRAEQYFLRDRTQFKIAKNQLSREYTKKGDKSIRKKLLAINGNSSYYHPIHGELRADKLVDMQLEDIKDPRKYKIIGLTWHHKEDYGIMELVNSDVHNKVPHIGGRSIWGGGRNYR